MQYPVGLMRESFAEVFFCRTDCEAFILDLIRHARANAITESEYRRLQSYDELEAMLRSGFAAVLCRTSSAANARESRAGDRRVPRKSEPRNVRLQVRCMHGLRRRTG